jgi:5-methylcytosine-specific restriction endonuclease McrA
MPTAPRSSCTTPGCRDYAKYRGKCEAHSRQANAARGTTKERGYGADWQRLRDLKLATTAICEIRTHCDGAIADSVDHIIPFRGKDDPLRLEWSNLQSACTPCNSAKAAKAGERPAVWPARRETATKPEEEIR